MSKQNLDTVFRRAFEGWKPEAPPRRQTLDGQMRSAFSSFAPVPTRNWVALRSGRTFQSKTPWIALGYAGALILAVLLGLAQPGPPEVIRSVSAENLRFVPEGPGWQEHASEHTLAENSFHSRAMRRGNLAFELRNRDRSDAAAVNSSKIPLTEPEATNEGPAANGIAVSNALLHGEDLPPTAVEALPNLEIPQIEGPLMPELHQPVAEASDLAVEEDAAEVVSAAQDFAEVLHPNRVLPDSNSEAERAKVVGASADRTWLIDVRLGMNWGVIHSQHSLPQQVSLDEKDIARGQSSDWQLQVGFEKKLGAGFTLNSGLRIQRELQQFNRAALYYAPLNSVATGPVHSNILSPVGPVSGLGMEIDYFAPEGENYSLNADSWLQGPMMGLELEFIEVAAVLGLGFRSGQRKGMPAAAWSWRAEVLFMPGLVLSQRAEAYSTLGRSDVGEIQGLRTLTLRGAISAAVVYEGFKGLSLFVGPSAFLRMQSANSLPGSSGLPVSLGLHGGVLF